MDSRSPDPTEGAPREEAGGGVGAPALEAGVRVLLAEDVRVNQVVGRKILEQLGCRVDVVSNGLEALRALQLERYAVVFMDVQMPLMDGLAATRMIRSGTGGVLDPRVPVVAMTGQASGGDEESCRAAGMDDFLEKPPERDAVRRLLERWAAAPRPPAGPG